MRRLPASLSVHTVNILPVFDEICRRSMFFVYKCMSHESELIRFIIRHGILFALTRSVNCSNVIFCSERYNFRIDDLINGHVYNTTEVSITLFTQ